jgi:hypothetical protein
VLLVVDWAVAVVEVVEILVLLLERLVLLVVLRVVAQRGVQQVALVLKLHRPQTLLL